MEVQLKKWQPDDKTALAAIGSGVDRRFLSDRLPDPYTEAAAENWLRYVAERDGKTGVFRAIVADGKIVGTISVEQREDIYRKDAEIGYFLVTAQWSRGIMTEAVSAVTNFLFSEVGVNRIEISHAVKNPASGRVAEKYGFRFEGTKREYFKAYSGEFLDISYRGLVRSDWQSK